MSPKPARPPRRAPIARSGEGSAPSTEVRRRCGPRRAARGPPASVAKERADAFDRLEVLAVLDRPPLPAVRERLVDGQVEPVLGDLHLRPVERALGLLGRDAPAPGTTPRGAARSLLEEENLDAPVGGRLQRGRPARRRAAVPACLLAPALDDLALALGPPALEHRLREPEQLGGL